MKGKAAVFLGPGKAFDTEKYFVILRIFCIFFFIIEFLLIVIVILFIRPPSFVHLLYCFSLL